VERNFVPIQKLQILVPEGARLMMRLLILDVPDDRRDARMRDGKCAKPFLP
jgi:hypothetical protein